MSVALVTGSGGLIGSETVRFLHEKGLDIVGIDNDMRAYYFGSAASTLWNVERLSKSLPRYRHQSFDIRDGDAMERLFRAQGRSTALIVHCASQPSHDWAAREPLTDFGVNAQATLQWLEATRRFCPEACFVFLSTNKVYGDTPNGLPLVETETRWTLDPSHPYAAFGIDEAMSVDQSKHSIFGVSKLAADVMCQEYGRYFGLKTTVFRGGCLTGPAHTGAELHGFLAYLVKCQMTGLPYKIHGYKGKQVRDNIHSADLVRAIWEVFTAPRAGAVYNMGGGLYSNCSMLEAIGRIREMTGRNLSYTVSDQARSGDHVWWISDVRKFRHDYPSWDYAYGLDRILSELIEAVREGQMGHS